MTAIAGIPAPATSPEIQILPSPEPLRADEARRLTDRIRERLGDLKMLVLTAYEGQVHIALGYLSWEAYVDGELGISRSHTYALMDVARAERGIQAILGSAVVSDSQTATPISVPIRVARGIDLSEALSETRSRLNGDAGDAAAVLATFRQVADEMRARPPEPDESVAETDSRHVMTLEITEIVDPKDATRPAWLLECGTGWNRGWCRVMNFRDPRDVTGAVGELLDRYRRHLRGETLPGSDLQIARARAATHDPSDWSGPIERDGIEGWVSPVGHFYPSTSEAARKMISKRIALGLPIS